MATSNWGIVTADGADAGNVPVAMAEMQASIEGATVARFATVAARATATSAFLALFPGTTGMVAYVTDRGKCVYDGNARAGSGGWTWAGQSVQLMSTAPAGTAGSGTWVTIGSVTSLNHGSFNRRVRVSLIVNMWNASSTLTSAAKGDTIVRRNTVDLPEIRVGMIILPHGSGAGQIDSGSSNVHGGSSFEYVWTGTSDIDVRLRRDGGTGGSVSCNAQVQVTDLGPAD